MYTDKQLNEIFKPYVKIFNKYYFATYKAICMYFQENPCDTDRFHFHHIFPSFLFKEENQLKNRVHTVEKLDENYLPKDNVVKLPVKWHVIAHYCLAMALLTQDAVNSFFILVGDYSKPIEKWTFNEIQTTAQFVDENAVPNTFDRYISLSERKEMNKKLQKENQEKYETEHKEELEQKKAELKEKQKAYKEQWKKDNKEKIEEQKKKQKEYIKKLKEQYKNKN